MQQKILSYRWRCNVKVLVLLEVTEIPIEYVGLFLLLVFSFIMILEINSRRK